MALEPTALIFIPYLLTKCSQKLKPFPRHVKIEETRSGEKLCSNVFQRMSEFDFGVISASVSCILLGTLDASKTQVFFISNTNNMCAHSFKKIARKWERGSTYLQLFTSLPFPTSLISRTLQRGCTGGHHRLKGKEAVLSWNYETFRNH